MGIYIPAQYNVGEEAQLLLSECPQWPNLERDFAIKKGLAYSIARYSVPCMLVEAADYTLLALTFQAKCWELP